MSPCGHCQRRRELPLSWFPWAKCAQPCMCRLGDHPTRSPPPRGNCKYTEASDRAGVVGTSRSAGCALCSGVSYARQGSRAAPADLGHYSVTDTRILFIHYGGDPIRGSERMLIDLVTGLPPGIEPVVWCNSSALAQEP